MRSVTDDKLDHGDEFKLEAKARAFYGELDAKYPKATRQEMAEMAFAIGFYLGETYRKRAKDGEGKSNNAPQGRNRSKVQSIGVAKSGAGVGKRKRA